MSSFYRFGLIRGKVVYLQCFPKQNVLIYVFVFFNASFNKDNKMVKVGEYDLLESITVIDIDSEPISVNLGDGEQSLTFIFKFVTDDKVGDSNVQYSVIDNLTAEVKLINFDNFNAGGNTKLIHLGTLNKRSLYYNFRVFGLKESGNTIILNFYLGKEVNDVEPKSTNG